MRHFTYKSLSELQQDSKRVGAAHVHLEEDAGRVAEILARPVLAGGQRVGNSIAIHPMEGCDGGLDGTPGELTWRRYRRFAAGGAKLIWFEATAVREDGRANPRQLWIHEKTWPAFARLLGEMRSIHDDLLIPMQLTHSGRYSVPKRIIAYHNPLIDQTTGTGSDEPVISDGDLERLEDDYVAAARLAYRAGFRAFDVKVTHAYLLSELSGAKLREGRYGGALKNRTRFACNVLRKLRQDLGRDVLLCMRLGCFDGVPHRKALSGVGEPLPFPTPYPHGFGVDPSDPMREELSEVKQAIQLFLEAGLQLLNVSLGSPYYNPHLGRPFEMPDEGNYEQPEHPLLGVDRHFRIAGELQRTFPDLPMVGTGYSWLQRFAVNAAAHNLTTGAIRFFGLGRGSLAYPEFARDVLSTGQLQERRVCKTLTYCTYLMRQKDHPLGQWPTGCPPFDKEVYGPLIKEVRAAKRSAAPA